MYTLTDVKVRNDITEKYTWSVMPTVSSLASTSLMVDMTVSDLRPDRLRSVPFSSEEHVLTASSRMDMCSERR